MTLSIVLLPALLVVYYLVVWLLVGRDPKPGTIVARYEPPELSPAAVRYLLIAGSDGKSLAAALADLVWRKRIAIFPENGRYRLAFLNVPPTAAPLPVEEQKILDLLSARGVPTMDPADSEWNSTLITAIQGSLSSRLKGIYFTGNFGYNAMAFALSAVWALLVASGASKGSDGITFLTFWFMIFGAMMGAIIVVRVIPALKDAFAGRLKLRSALLMSLCLLMAIMPAFVLYEMAEMSSVEFVWMIAAVLLIHFIFGPLMKTATPKGRDMLDRIEGYRQFLLSVERDRLDRLNPPQSPPTLLGQELAYAIALDLKQAWGDHLSEAFFAATVSKGG
jgi:Predicted membrane protein (DUF2207)